MRLGGSLGIGCVAALVVWSSGCGGDAGLIDCAGYIDKQIECEIIPPENAAAVRDTNVRICNNWEATFKAPVMEALDQCIDVPCAEVQTCAAQANQLCQDDVSGSIELLCEKVVECGWEDLTTMEVCRQELAANTGLYSCWRPDVLDDYVACVRGISCGPDSEDEWYGCGFAIQSR